MAEVVLGCMLTLAAQGLLNLVRLHRIKRDLDYIHKWLYFSEDLKEQHQQTVHRWAEQELNRIYHQQRYSLLEREAWRRVF